MLFLAPSSPAPLSSRACCCGGGGRSGFKPRRTPQLDSLPTSTGRRPVGNQLPDPSLARAKCQLSLLQRPEIRLVASDATKTVITGRDVHPPEKTVPEKLLLNARLCWPGVTRCLTSSCTRHWGGEKGRQRPLRGEGPWCAQPEGEFESLSAAGFCLGSSDPVARMPPLLPEQGLGSWGEEPKHIHRRHSTPPPPVIFPVAPWREAERRYPGGTLAGREGFPLCPPQGSQQGRGGARTSTWQVVGAPD